jgi:hypothetical protein
LEANGILETLMKNRDKIDSIDLMIDKRLNIVKAGEPINLQNELVKIGPPVSQPSF